LSPSLALSHTTFYAADDIPLFFLLLFVKKSFIYIRLTDLLAYSHFTNTQPDIFLVLILDTEMDHLLEPHSPTPELLVLHS